MSERDEFIRQTVESLTPAAPKILRYHNGYLVAFRNGDGERVATILEHTLTPDQITQRINTLFKVKTENVPSEETLKRLQS